MTEVRGSLWGSSTPAGPVGVISGALSGAWAGFIGGGVMIVVMMCLYFTGSQGFWEPPKIIGSMLLGPGAVFGGAGAVVFGLFWHMVLAMGFGALFGAAMALFFGRRQPVVVTLILGVIYSGLIWALSQPAVLLALTPWVAQNLVPWIFRGGLVLYGLTLGGVPTSYQREWATKYLPAPLQRR